MPAEWQSDKMASDMEMHTKQSCVTEFLRAAIITPNDVYRHSLSVYGDQTVGVSTVRRWLACFSSGDSALKDKPRPGRSCTAVTPRNEERLDQIIRANRRITAGEMSTELTIGFSALETMVAALEYRNVCARWVPRVLTQEHKEHRMQVCRDLSNQYEAASMVYGVVPKFAGSNPPEAVRIFQGEKILSTPSFGREVKPWVPCRRFAERKISLN